MDSAVKFPAMLFLFLVFTTMIGCGGDSKTSSAGKRCEVVQRQMRDSARIIAGCKAYLSMPDLAGEQGRYATEFAKINLAAVKKMDAGFRYEGKWPAVIEDVQEWQLACYALMLVMNESSRNKSAANRLSGRLEKCIRAVKAAEEAIKKHCPGIKLADTTQK